MSKVLCVLSSFVFAKKGRWNHPSRKCSCGGVQKHSEAKEREIDSSSLFKVAVQSASLIILIIITKARDIDNIEDK